MSNTIDGVKVQNFSKHKYFLNQAIFVIPLLIAINFSFFCLPEPYSTVIFLGLFSVGFIVVIDQIYLLIFKGKDAFFLPTNPPFNTSHKTQITERQLLNGCGYDYLIFIEKEILLILEDKKYFFDKEKIKTIKINFDRISFTNLKNETIEFNGFTFDRKKADRLLKFIVANCDLRVENCASR